MFAVLARMKLQNVNMIECEMQSCVVDPCILVYTFSSRSFDVEKLVILVIKEE